MRLIYVMGMPSGGTSAVSRILAMNAFWASHIPEQKEAIDVLGDIFEPDPDLGPFQWKHRPIDASDRQKAHNIFTEYKTRANGLGFPRCFMKSPGRPIWVPKLFFKNSCTPLLVYRDPTATANSMWAHHKNRFRDEEECYRIALSGQQQILKLREEYGWPIWEFSREASQDLLADILGVKLPINGFDPERIKHE